MSCTRALTSRLAPYLTRIFSYAIICIFGSVGSVRGAVRDFNATLSLIDSLNGAGNYDSALTVGASVFQTAKNEFGATSVPVADVLTRLASSELGIRNSEEGLGYAQQALRIYQLNPAESVSGIVTCFYLQGRALFDQVKLEE